MLPKNLKDYSSIYFFPQRKYHMSVSSFGKYLHELFVKPQSRLVTISFYHIIVENTNRLFNLFIYSFIIIQSKKFLKI